MRLSRFTVFALCIAAAIVLVAALAWRPHLWPLALVAMALVGLGLFDLTQTRHSVRRNYPVIGNFRWLIEWIRPEIRQYLIEGDEDEAPFSRSQRSLVYARAKGESSERPFGTQLDVYRDGYEFIAPSIRPVPVADPASFRVTIGGDQCAQPYSASLFNISAMSFGSLSANAIRALNRGAQLGNFYQDSGEGGISAYHREHGGDLVWEIGSGYFGCRTADGAFDPERFAALATMPQVRMIEIKLSQGAKPGHGGILPGAKVTPEIAAVRGVPVGQDCVSPSGHSAFTTPIEMMQFIARLRDLSGGKPVGFKLCIGHPWEFMAIVKAMIATGIRPDFIVVDGAEGGTGAAPLEFTNHLGVPMREGMLFVHNTLVGAGLRQHIRIGAAGKVVSAFDIASLLAIGADWTNAARGFMFAIGCIQSLSCNTNRCPAGVATQDPLRQRALVVPDKAERVHRFHHNTMHALAEMLAAAGIERPGDLAPHHLARRVSETEIRLFSQMHVFLETGELLAGAHDRDFYGFAWEMADAASFQPRVTPRSAGGTAAPYRIDRLST
ncbi:FMN-binding glutamate synthase family protein [Novosphingobium album (ex Liu et al. 2023)]|uniref:FMN-binding glutamate synthase family protein n=1 Tax=Novosphingobium album (ex Liu et al. 2023) TaxID=3031130 RepID=A0ABT5WKQ0_9SPHN|nr:FMN-binding glutamate synthase family protein [Novosphingobium album (ex Liu et al. 2023)]MDE8650625.1 FMN-binding glutamate synthase family protein [Novosphingobium album (ex Liu et al. 2023)]